MNPEVTEAASAGPARSGARRRLRRRTVLLTIAVLAAVLAVIDQITKNWAEANLPLLEPQPFLGEVLQLTLLYNTGAAWGMGSEITPVITVLQIAIVIGAIIFAVKAVRSIGHTVALGLIIGGALGNIHDRLLREPGPFRGAVVDFLELPRWPVFNIADTAVVGGAILIIALGLFNVAADPAMDETATDETATDETATDDAAPDEPAADDTAPADPATVEPGPEDAARDQDGSPEDRAR